MVESALSLFRQTKNDTQVLEVEVMLVSFNGVRSAHSREDALARKALPVARGPEMRD